VRRPFRLALPSKGRLQAPAAQLAAEAGIEASDDGRALFARCPQWGIEILRARTDDIPAWLDDGAVDAAIVGENQLVEAGVDAEVLARLGFGRCSLTVAADAAGAVQHVEQLAGCRVATSYPRTVATFFARRDVAVELVKLGGSVELAPRLDAAEAIADLVSTGETLRQNGLRPLATILASEAVLVARPGLEDADRELAGRLATVVGSVIAARDKRYVMLNAPDASLDEIVALLPGLDSPTVLPLARGDMHAVHAVVDRAQVVELLAPLRAAGARSVLVLPIEHLMP